MTEPPQAVLPSASGREIVRHMLHATRGRRWGLLGTLMLFLAEAALSLVFPLVIGSLVDAVLAADPRSGGPAGGLAGLPPSVIGQLGLLLVAALSSGLLVWAGAVCLARIAEPIIATLREQYVAAALDLPRTALEAAGTGDVVTRASDDISQISATLPSAVPRLVVAVASVGLVGLGLGAVDLRFLAAFAVVVPLHVLAARWYLHLAPRVYAAERTAESVRGQQILAALTQHPTVVSHGWEALVLGRTRGATWESVRWSMRARIVVNRLFARLNTAEAAGLLSVLALGLWLAHRDQVSPGQVTASALLFLSAMAPLESLLLLLDDLQIALASLGRVIGVVQGTRSTTNATSTGGGTAGAATADGAASADGAAPLLELQGVSFGWDPERPVLERIDLQLRRGEVLAVVGATGAGKSTLAALAAGILEPTAGRIIRRADPAGIITITQETHLFAGTLSENLTLAAPARDAEILRALEEVEAHGVVAELPGGLGAELGDRPDLLSPAQIQQLALARVQLLDPELVILDEATAEAGSSDTAVLDRAAAAALRGRSAIVIAHRLSQVREADRILVLDRGCIAQLGTHHELLAAGGLYAQLWEAWTSTPRA